jgi:hypothetical protein
MPVILHFLFFLGIPAHAHVPVHVH